MLRPSFESWHSACGMVRGAKTRLHCYLQWFPFIKLNDADWKYIESAIFYTRFIEDASFILAEKMHFTADSFIQNKDSTLRGTKLVAPILYLYLLAVVIEFSQGDVETRSKTVSFYSGDIARAELHYKHSYSVFRDCLAFNSTKYQYYLKTDIKNFYNSISIDRLIQDMLDSSDGRYAPADLLVLKGLLLFCGEGKFPTIEDSPALSYLSTRVYLRSIDCSLEKSLSGLCFKKCAL